VTLAEKIARLRARLVAIKSQGRTLEARTLAYVLRVLTGPG